MRICYFGIYDPNFSRNRVYMKGLRSLGVEIVECRDSSPGWIKFWQLWKKHQLIMSSGGYDAMVVGYPGHLVVPLARVLAFRSRKIVIADLLGSLHDAVVHSHMPSWIELLKARVADWLAIKFASKVLLESEAQKKYFERRFWPSDKYVVVYTGVDEGVFTDVDAKVPHTDHNDFFTVFFRGKFTPECGIEHILNAAEILKGDYKIKFKIIGRGYLLETVERLVREKELHNVELIIKYIPDKEMRSAVSEASLYLGQFEDNHRLKRTIPHKAFEAFVAGIPYLSEDAPAIREIVKDGETGFLVPSADPKKLAEKIRYLSEDPDSIARVSRNARELYEKKLSSIKLAQEIIKLI